MAFQYHNSTTYTQAGPISGTSYNQTIGGDAGLQTTDSQPLGEVGSILTGTVLQGGDSPVVEMNGVAIQVKTTTSQPLVQGDRIYLKITHSSSSEITMKRMEESEISAFHHSGVTRTEIVKNTARFVQSWQQSQQELQPDYQTLSEDADTLLSSISEEEKAKLRQMGIEISSSNLTIVKSLLAQLRGNEQDARLQESIDNIRKQILIECPELASDKVQIALTNDSLCLSDVAGEADSLLPISSEQTVYLIQNQLPLNMENLYRSQYSASSFVPEVSVSESAYQQMQPQIERILASAGLTVSEDSEQAVQFLLQHQLPVTTDSLQTWFAIQDLNSNGFSSEQILEHLIEASAKAEPTDYRKLEFYYPTASETASQIMQDLSNITDSVIAEFSVTGLPYTLENLSAFYQQNQESASSFADTDSDRQTAYRNTFPQSAITAHRQLEELRLKMTWEASYALARQDIHLRTRELTEVVDALREQERNYYKEQFQSMGMSPTAESLQLAADTNRTMQELPHLPASALGSALFSTSAVFSLETLHTEGTIALRQLRAATTQNPTASYEALMTSPRSDMGDSIQKAFRNVDDLLKEQGLSLTEDNQRAVRILGYNQMEITPDAIAQVKAADAQVQELMQNLTPSVVLHLIREGKNPLNLPIEELNALVEDYTQEIGITDEDTYSEFLHKLEHRQHISKEERQGYIGVYRLLDKVSKSKGKDIGTLIKNGQGITLQNLLTAHRSNRASGMDWTLDDSFGGIETSVTDTTIDQQILTGFSANASYQSQLAKKLLHRLSPDMIDDMAREAENGTTFEEFCDTVQRQEADTTDLLLHPELELLSTDKQLSNVNAFMNQWNLFPSMTNLLMAANIQAKGNRTFQIYSEQEAPDSALEELTEHLTSFEDMEQAYHKLETDTADFIHQADADGSITAKDIQALKQIRSGLRIMQKLARNEQYEIPFSMNGTWNVIHLSVIRDSEQKGRIQASLPDTEYGTLFADLTWNENHWEGTMTSDTDAGTVFLERHHTDLSNALELSTREHITGNVSNTDTNTDVSVSAQIPSTHELYQVARQLVVFLKTIL